MNWIGWIILGGLAGWMASNLGRGKGLGCLSNILLGIVGAIVGGWGTELLGIEVSGTIDAFVMAVVGALVVLGLARLAGGGEAKR